MASFNRADYIYVFAFARAVFYDVYTRNAQKAAAAEVMMMIEDCIGQQEDFPPEARRYKRAKRC